MPRIKPIPKKLLGDTIEYESQITGDGWNDDYDEKQTISNVRIAPVSSMNRTADSQGRQGNDVIYVDRVNSSYFPSGAKAGDRINGREVIRVKKHKAFGDQIHNLEIEVI